jgi:hypothetical protein
LYEFIVGVVSAFLIGFSYAETTVVLDFYKFDSRMLLYGLGVCLLAS